MVKRKNPWLTLAIPLRAQNNGTGFIIGELMKEGGWDQGKYHPIAVFSVDTLFDSLNRELINVLPFHI
jgi:hypothetical protein